MKGKLFGSFLDFLFICRDKMGLSPWSLGIIFLIAVTLIWTFASLLTQFIYKDLGFDSPFVLTYISSSYFALHLPIRALLQYFGVIEDSTKRYKSSNFSLFFLLLIS